MKTMTTTLTGYTISGYVTLNLWGGGKGEIEMRETFIPANKFSKDNVLRCINDNGFGCESIADAMIYIRERYSNGGYGDSKEIFTDCKHHLQHAFKGIKIT